MRLLLPLLVLSVVACGEPSRPAMGAAHPPPPEASVGFEGLGDTWADEELLDDDPFEDDLLGGDLVSDDLLYDDGTGYDGPDPYDEFQRQQYGYARSQVEWERDDLKRSMRRLRNGDWEDDLPAVERDLRALDNAVWDLEMADPTGFEASELRWEVDRMKRDVRRLDSEDWRDVVPDLDRRTRSIDYETDALSSFDPSEDW